MSDIFISYRRQDSAAYAARLRADLALRYGDDRVFLDITDLAPGRDFVAQLHQVVHACKSVLVVIGPQWTTARDQNGQRRLDDPADFIRAEVAAALRAAKLVVPVLVGGATMPSREELPEDIQGIRLRNAGVLEDASWDEDLHRFYEVLDPLLGVAPRLPELAPRATAARLPLIARLVLAFDVLRGRVDRETKELSPVTRPPSPDRTPPLRMSEAADLVQQQHVNLTVTRKQVFLSYAEEDRALADQVVQLLEDRGQSCWVAHRDIPAGTRSWAGPIVAAIANSRLVVVLVTDHSVSSKQILREVTVADDENIPLIPVCIDNVPLSQDLKYFFASAQRLELANMPRQQTVQMIGTAVERHLATI